MPSHDKIIFHMRFGAFHITPRIKFSRMDRDGPEVIAKTLILLEHPNPGSSRSWSWFDLVLTGFGF